MPLFDYRSSRPSLREERDLGLANPLDLGRTFPVLTAPGGRQVGGYASTFERYVPLVRERWTKVFEAGDDRYRHWPERLSFDLYGTEDLWYLLMRLNYALTRFDFVGPRFTTVDVNHVGKLLDVCRKSQKDAADRGAMQLNYRDLTLRPVVA